MYELLVSRCVQFSENCCVTAFHSRSLHLSSKRKEHAKMWNISLLGKIRDISRSSEKEQVVMSASHIFELTDKELEAVHGGYREEHHRSHHRRRRWYNSYRYDCYDDDY